MAQYKIPDPDDLIECPYDNTHMIAAKRMQYHLMKCRKNHPGRELSVCPYNARHEVRKVELRYHMANCPDKARLEPMIIHEQTKASNGGTFFKGCTDLPNYDHHQNISSQENWDEEIPSMARIGVDPAYFARLNRRDLAGMSNAEKKEVKAQIFLPPEERYVPPVEEVKEEKKLRLPKKMPHAFFGPAASGSDQKQPATAVMGYTMSMAGLGRGRGLVKSTSGQKSESLAMVGRGRGIGRGVKIENSDAKVNGNTTYIPSTNNNTLVNGHSPTKDIKPPPGLPVQPVGVPNGHTEVFSMGLGRGRGLNKAYEQIERNGQPSFVVPNVKTQVSELQEKDAVNSGDDSTSSSGNPEDDKILKEKMARRIQKKLRQIEMLEAKVSEGYKMTVEEEIKFEKKDDLLQALEELSI